MRKYPDCLTNLISALKQLPSIGEKTAERLAFILIEWNHEKLDSMSDAIKNLPKQLYTCNECGCLEESTNDTCSFCNIDKRDASQLCIIASQKDVFSIEGTKHYKGMYHILGNLMSPITGKKLKSQTIEALILRVKKLKPKEIIIALDATLEGEATSLFIKKELSFINASISRLALGIPIGMSFDYLDQGTLCRAFSGRGLY